VVHLSLPHPRPTWPLNLLALALCVGGAPAKAAEDAFAAARLQMVSRQIEARGVRDPRALDALRRVERHRFVPERLRDQAYQDRPLAIGHGQTISQPYIVALMTELARVKAGDRVLEIGTGSGYQAAVLSALAGQVYTIEIVEPLAREAATRLETLGYRNVTVRAGDGYRGWPERAPFDAILITAAPPEIPQPLLDQLAPGGRLVAPVGDQTQELVVVERSPAGLMRRSVIPVRFVPMTGEAQGRR
jgi:protein-L-isoaspartate(D-aspartate) O-methyltransferase